MTEFIFGRSAREKTEYLLEKIEEQLRSGKKIIMIVPEQQALYWDSLAARRISPRDAFLVETVSFTRLADSVFRLYGGVAKHYITDAEKTLIMWNAMTSVAPRLTVYGELRRAERYTPMMRHAISEMKLYGTSPADLETAADKIEAEEAGGASSLAARLRDLSLIAAAYDTMLHSCYDDPEEIPDALCDILERRDFFGDSAVFIDCFYTLTPKEMKIVSHIFRQCPDVYVTYPMDHGDRKNEHMEYVWGYVCEMSRLASSAGRDVKIVNCSSSLPPALNYLSEKLWDYSASPISDSDGCVKIIKCADRTDEAVLCAARIKELVRGGADYSDIVVTAADFESLRGITDIELERCGIPVYVSGKTPVTDQPAMRLLLKAAAVAAGGWRRDDLVSCAASGLCGLTPDQSDAFEKYTGIWSISGKKKFCAEDGWSMNPGGYTDAMSDWSAVMLRLANEAREILIPPIEAFCSSFGSTAAEICRAAVKLFCDFGVYDSLRTEVEKLSSQGDYAAAQKKSQVWGAVMSVIDSIATAVPDAHMDAASFAAMLRRGADECSIGTIPDGIDRVTAGSVGSIRFEGARHIIVLGASAGEFPRTPSENGFFSDADKEILRSAGVELSPCTTDKIGEELFLFRHTISSAAETVTLIIPASDDGAVRPSSGVQRVIKLISNAEILDLSDSKGSEAVRKYSELSVEESFSHVSLSADSDCLPADCAEDVFGNILNMTQSRLECFNDCAFKYYTRYVLNLDEGRAVQLSPADVGNFVHKILEDFMRESADGGFPMEDSVIVSRSDRLIKNYIARVCPAGAKGRLDYLFSRISRSVRLYARSLNEEFAQSSFVPYRFELPVGTDSLPSCPIELDGGKRMSLHGIVDRVDVYRNGDKIYLRVADYKTGAKKFSLSSVLSGKNVQLLLYLFSLCQSPQGCEFRRCLAPNGEKILPAGAVYFSARPGETSNETVVEGDEARNVALRDISRSGIVLSDNGVIDAMDKGITGRYVPVKMKKDGGYTAYSSVATEEEFENIRRTMTDALAGLGKRIISGEACSIPDDTKAGQGGPCAYCAARAVCRHCEKSAVSAAKSNAVKEENING